VILFVNPLDHCAKKKEKKKFALQLLNLQKLDRIMMIGNSI